MCCVTLCITCVGTPFKFGDKCRLKHIPTQKYLAVRVPGTEFESVNELYY